MVDIDAENRTPKPRFAPKQVEDAEVKPGLLRPSILFLGLAIALTGAIAGWLGFVDTNDDIRLEITDVSVEKDGNVALTGARYRGRTASGKLFEIIAASAIETAENPGSIDLDMPNAKIFSGDGGILTITSRVGAYSQSASAVDLQGDVVVNDTTYLMTLQTQTLRASFSSGDMETNSPVRVTGKDRLVVAQGMQIFDHGEVIIFSGKPKMTLHNAAVFE